VPNGDHAGFAGFYPDQGATLVMEAAGRSTSEVRASSTIGTTDAQTNEGQEVRHYQQGVKGLHTYAAGHGSVTYEGKGRLKVVGLDFEIQSANLTQHETGIEQTGPTEVRESWVVLAFVSEAALTMADAQTVEFAMPTLSARGAGDLSFTTVAGELRTEEGTYLSTGGRAVVGGTFEALLQPVGRTDGLLTLHGDLRPSSSFVRQPAPSVFGAESPAWWGVGLLVGAVLVGGAAVTIHKLRPRVRPMWRRGAPGALRTSADRRQAKRLLAYDRLLARVRAGDVERNHLGAALYVVASKVAEAEEDWAVMYDFMRAARLGCPDMAEYAMREGFALFYMGETTKAAGAFNDATYHDRQSGEPWYWLARCQARGGHLDDAEGTLARALGLTPGLLDDVETCADFAPLLERPRFLGIREAIHVRLDAEQDEKDNF
jgi:hypothetical protein